MCSMRVGTKGVMVKITQYSSLLLRSIYDVFTANNIIYRVGVRKVVCDNDFGTEKVRQEQINKTCVSILQGNKVKG